MNIFDYELMGRLIDEMGEDDITQEQLNEMKIREADALTFLNNISKRLSKYSLNYYIDEFKVDEKLLEEDPESYYQEDFRKRDFWLLVLRKIIKNYKLTCLSLFLHKMFDMSDLPNQIIQLLTFIKLDIIEKCSGEKEDKIIDLEKDIKTPEDMLTYNSDAPILFKWAMKYITEDDFLSFVDIVKKEMRSEYFEI